MQEFSFTAHRPGTHYQCMKKIISASLISLCILCANTPNISADDSKRQNPRFLKAGQSYEKEARSSMSFKNIIGNWRLKYSGNYGYCFNLYPNYRALVIIYLNTQSLIFRGVYTIDEKNKLKINISEMKEEPRTSGFNLGGGFVKAKSSYFLFSGYRVIKDKSERLYLRPSAIVIDGKNSDGYFEPFIRLTKEPR
jgi:hypothetical protein